MAIVGHIGHYVPRVMYPGGVTPGWMSVSLEFSARVSSLTLTLTLTLILNPHPHPTPNPTPDPNPLGGGRRLREEVCQCAQ